jgi:hypothetical protein
MAEVDLASLPAGARGYCQPGVSAPNRVGPRAVPGSQRLCMLNDGQSSQALNPASPDALRAGDGSRSGDCLNMRLSLDTRTGY